jgi:MurNAc alpha-1-phosphate uridylyltransferase
MILAAGRGERLRPLTDSTPKPLLQAGKLKLIEYHLLALAAAGIARVVINLSHLGQQIQDYLGDGSAYGIDIIYSPEPLGALETAGGIRHALELLNAEQFLVVNGDIFCDISFNLQPLNNDVSMHLIMVPNPVHHPDGDFFLDQSTNPAHLRKKKHDSPGVTFSGVGLYHQSVFAPLPDRAQALAPVILQHIEKSSVTAQLHQGQWLDVGTLDRLEQARSLSLKS